MKDEKSFTHLQGIKELCIYDMEAILNSSIDSLPWWKLKINK